MNRKYEIQVKAVGGIDRIYYYDNYARAYKTYKDMTSHCLLEYCYLLDYKTSKIIHEYIGG